MDFAIRGNVLGANDLGGFPPDLAFSIRGSDNVLLVVHGAEDVVPTHANRENNGKVRPAQVNWVTDEEVRLESVHVREPDSVTPSEVESKVVMGNVNGAKVPVLRVLIRLKDKHQNNEIPHCRKSQSRKQSGAS